MKKFLILTILAIFAIPLCSVIPFRIEGGWYGHYLGILFFGLLAVGFVLWGFNKFLSLFYIHCLLSTFNFFQIIEELLRIIHKPNFLFVSTFMNIVAYFLSNIEPRALILLITFGIFALASYGISKFPSRYIKYIFWVILGILLIQSFWIGLQLNNKDPIFYCLQDPSKASPVGSIGSPNQTGIFFALTFPIMLYIHPLLGILNLIGLFISKTSFAFIAMVISGLLYLFFISKKIFAIAILSVLLIGGIFFLKIDKPKLCDFKTRLSVWDYAIQSVIGGRIEINKNSKDLIYKINPICGYGFSRFLTIFPFVRQKNNFNYADEKFTHAHNDYIELFFELGWIGGILLILLIVNFIYSFIKIKKSREIIALFCGLLSYLICASGNFLMQMAIPGIFLIVFYGLYKGAIRQNGKIAPVV